MRGLLLTSTIALLIVGSSGCRSSRYACERAEGMIAKAAALCPAVLQEEQHTDSALIVTPGGTGQGATAYTQADMDALLTRCNELVRRAQLRASVNRDDAAEVRRQLATEQRAILDLRSTACDFKPLTVADTLLMLKVWADGDSLRYFYNVLPQARLRYFTHTCAKVDLRNVPCAPRGVATWYRTGFWILAVIVLITTGAARRLLGAIR